MTRFVARFKVEGWEERTVDGVDGGWVGVARFSKEFTAGLIGTAVTLFLSSGEVEGERSYVAAERITATTDDGRAGSITVHHGGLESDPATWFGHVVPHSGTDDFADWSGSARIEHDDDGPYFTFELD